MGGDLSGYFQQYVILTSVSDPDSFDTDPDPDPAF
jgi:hypothetical protein